MSIYEKQQTSGIKKCLAVQREIYSEGKTRNTIQLILLMFSASVMLFAASFPNALCCLEPEIVRAVAMTFNAACIVCMQVLADNCKNKQAQAADVQQYIDAHLYSEAIGNAEKDWRHVKDKTEIDEILSHYPAYDGSHMGAWYENYSEYLPLVQVLKCQMENICWDDYLRQYYLWGVYGVSAAIVILSLAVFCLAQNKAVVFCMLLSSAFPVFKYCWTLWEKIGQERKNLDSMRKTSNHLLQKLLDEKIAEADALAKVIDLQEQLFNHRKLCFLIPDWFHSRLFDFIHSRISYKERCAKEK